MCVQWLRLYFMFPVMEAPSFACLASEDHAFACLVSGDSLHLSLSICTCVIGTIFTYTVINKPRCSNTCLWGFRQSVTQTSLLNY